MFITGVLIGCLILLEGIISLVTGKTVFWRNSAEKYTADSLKLYAQLSGILHIVMGIAVMAFFFGRISSLSMIICWGSIFVLWLAAAVNVILYLIALVKK